MDINKWKSVAVRKKSHTLLQALCLKEYRKPAEYIELLIDKEVARRAKERGMTQEAYLNKIMKDSEYCHRKNIISKSDVIRTALFSLCKDYELEKYNQRIAT